MINQEIKNTIIEEICSLIGSKQTPSFLVEHFWVELDSGIWLLSKDQQMFLETYESETIRKKMKYGGIYLGKIRKKFGLSIEALYPLQPFITRYTIIKGKTLQKYLYGKSVSVQILRDSIDNLQLQKIIIMTPNKEPVGIAGFTIIDGNNEKENMLLTLRLEPITDLGMFLRNERTMFE